MDVEVSKFNEAYVRVTCNGGIEYELRDYFSFFVPGYQYMPKFKSKIWDGKLYLYDVRKKLLYHGLAPYIERFCKERNYTLDISDDVIVSQEFSVVEAKAFIDTLNLPHKVRDYQLKAFIKAIRDRRMLLLSPTGSGKSLIIYLIIRYLQTTKQRGLLLVPTISLVSQMYKDFEDYGYKSEDFCHMIHAGRDKGADKFLYISTWQSIYRLPKDYFRQFDFIIGDEAHLFKAQSLTGILSLCENAECRIGTTGTLDGKLVHKLVLEGLFGSVYKATTTSDLIEKNQLSKFKIKCLILKYPKEICAAVKKMDYQDEIDFIVRNEARNRFIRNLALSLTGNTLLLFQFVEKHGQVLYKDIFERATDRKVFFIHGGTDVEVREAVRKITEGEENAIILASYGTFSTGINIRNLHNIITASPSKSKVRNLQSIGRVLRLGDNKEEAILYDISDDMRVGKHQNHTLKHFIERIKIYDEEKFEYKFYNIEIKG